MKPSITSTGPKLINTKGSNLQRSHRNRNKQKHTQNTRRQESNTPNTERHLHHRMAQMLSETARPGNSQRMRVSQAVTESCVRMLLIYPRPPEALNNHTTNGKQHLFYLLKEKKKARCAKNSQDLPRSNKFNQRIGRHVPSSTTCRNRAQKHQAPK